MNISDINIPGFYLRDTLQGYLKYERGINPENFDVFMFKHNHLQRIIDDEAASVLASCIFYGNKAEFLYGKDKISTTVIPLKIIIEHNYGRQYLFALNDSDKRPILRRLDKIMNIKASDKLGDSFKFTDYERYIENSWCATLLNEKEGLIRVEVEFIFKEGAEDYILNRLRREGRWGNIERLEEGRYLYSIEVTDPLELVPWLRSFAGFCRVRHSDSHDLSSRLREDSEEALRKYGFV
jgi:hypothetical protein